MLRVLHEFADADDLAALRAVAEQLRQEPGCASAELYATLAEGEDRLALTMLWDDEAAYDEFWARALAGEHPALVTPLTGGTGPDDIASTEFYRRATFALRAGTWVPEHADEGTRKIFWPAGGPVRIIIQNAVHATEAMYDKIRAEIAETRREEGCLDYGWYEDVDLPGHLLLLELWADQVVYDRHWALRGATAAFVGDNLRVPAEPQRGPVAREFYRWQDFRHHYDRWLPADPDAYATTVLWPAG
ncbi:Antibiotic biosynthesis monooxygenase [Raineyella antarctica]|uniref:Antibiotic biosynthesis monooxygenase n=1 Tax=Raineyella antarctica TaxID=1577474 RepID=A0A1G6GFN8_9ACTN|nr:antibiotic biosynthesis monooxygenase [Raineyella antarctica]SDB80575.1 Antibiotic biosynthesis monooxygenase [Raineyella antarctica]